MSHDDVALIRGAFEAFVRQDIDDLLGRFADTVKWDTPASLPWGGRYSGKEAVRGLITSLGDHVEEIVPEPQQYLEGHDYVVVLGRHRGRLRGGSKDFDVPFAMVWWTRDGQAVAFREYTDTAAILASRDG